jgi:hypothetical protein
MLIGRHAFEYSETARPGCKIVVAIIIADPACSKSQVRVCRINEESATMVIQEEDIVMTGATTASGERRD